MKVLTDIFVSKKIVKMKGDEKAVKKCKQTLTNFFDSLKSKKKCQIKGGFQLTEFFVKTKGEKNQFKNVNKL